MRKTVLVGLLAGLTCALSIPAVAQIYQWHDKNGVRHYGDRPPPAVDAREIRNTPKLKTEDETSVYQRFNEQLQVMQRSRDDSTRDRNRPYSDEEAAEDALARDCERARNQLSALKSARALSRTTADGEREQLDEETRVRERERTRQFLDSNCR